MTIRIMYIQTTTILIQLMHTTMTTMHLLTQECSMLKMINTIDKALNLECNHLMIQDLDGF